MYFYGKTMSTLEEITSPIISIFKENIESVYNLMDFDDVVLDYAIRSLETLCTKLESVHAIKNPRLSAEQTLKHIKDIRKNKSLQKNYEEIYNQCVVLLVSYFGSAIQDIFEECITYSLSIGSNQNLLDEEFKVTVKEIRELKFDLSGYIGTLLVENKKISFQDMKSIRRAFQKYFEIDTEKNRTVNNIILGQACRHVIVHSGSVINRKLINQVSDCTPRTLKVDLTENNRVQFQPNEVELLGKSMYNFIESVDSKLKKAINPTIPY